MTKKEYVVRIVQTEYNEGGMLNDAFLESLRYAGLLKIHEIDNYGLTIRCFDIHCVDDSGSYEWAEMNAARMRTFGFNAVSAPKS